MRSLMVGLMLAAVLLAPTARVQAANPGHRAARWNKFSRQHPRRSEVNRRLADQRSRIDQGLRSGKLTPAQAKQLEANDGAIKQQERTDLKANGGHLTKAEQKQLNQEENANSQLIRDEKHPRPEMRVADRSAAQIKSPRCGQPQRGVSSSQPAFGFLSMRDPTHSGRAGHWGGPDSCRASPHYPDGGDRRHCHHFHRHRGQIRPAGVPSPQRTS